MIDAKRLMDQFLGGGGGRAETAATGPAGLGNAGGIAGGALAGGLAGLLTGTKTGRKLGKNALTYGGMALVGGLAYKAWSDWRAGNQPAAAPAGGRQPAFQEPPAGSPFLPAAGEANGLAQALLRAMIGAAKADGHIDAAEQQRIFKQVNELGLDAESKAFVMDELARPLDVDAIAAGATCPETAAEIYAASLIAIDPDRPAEKSYLANLAARMRLEPALVDHLHASVRTAMA
jgi:uncharacterized membrane protein YebE (DUF533 family)